MLAAIQGITYAVPARYFVTLLKGIYVKGVGRPTEGRLYGSCKAKYRLNIPNVRIIGKTNRPDFPSPKN